MRFDFIHHLLFRPDTLPKPSSDEEKHDAEGAFMKKTFYKFGDHKCEAYFKEVGHGFEVGFYFGKNTVFVGNFIHQREAAKWWAKMNREMKTFTTRYRFNEDASFTWYTKFFSHHLYKAYYSFLDDEFSKYRKTFSKAWEKDEKKYFAMKKKWQNDTQFFDFKKAV